MLTYRLCSESLLDLTISEGSAQIIAILVGIELIKPVSSKYLCPSGSFDSSIYVVALVVIIAWVLSRHPIVSIKFYLRYRTLTLLLINKIQIQRECLRRRIRGRQAARQAALSRTSYRLTQSHHAKASRSSSLKKVQSHLRENTHTSRFHFSQSGLEIKQLRITISSCRNKQKQERLKVRRDL